MDFCKKMLIKYREIIIYGFFGVLTTAVNYGIYLLFTRVIPISESTIVPNIIAFVVSVVFAYLTNRTWVFQSQVKGASGIAKEFSSFFSMRMLSGVLDIAFVYLAVDILLGNDLVWKLVSNVVIIILNFVISKLFVFKKTKEDK